MAVIAMIGAITKRVGGSASFAKLQRSVNLLLTIGW
jgi:hypothetical protein